MYVGKYYKMLVSRRVDVETEKVSLKKDSSLVYFFVDKIIMSETSDFKTVFEVWTNERITIEKKHSKEVSRIGYIYEGKRFVPWNDSVYSYEKIEEISKELFSRKVKQSKYGL
jgi:hypothetical protein